MKDVNAVFWRHHELVRSGLVWSTEWTRAPLSLCNLCELVRVTVIGVDLAGLLGGRMASAEGGSLPSGVGYGEGCPLSSRLRGLGERRELPQRSPGQLCPGRKRILAYFECHRTPIFVPI